ncbi:MAG: hypothetical protein KDK35_12600 [Leptospiraceae bacterium]|nr:hypothetical protein [Leptospiraceae bacterium]
MSFRLTFRLLASTTLLFFSALCSLFQRQTTRGAVTFYDSIPAQCNTTRGLRQQEVRVVHSESELREHYGLTFIVRFNDGVSPALYGTLYYQDQSLNRYCMALPDGRFAVFSDSSIDAETNNFVQEVCYPIKDCLQDPIPTPQQ